MTSEETERHTPSQRMFTARWILIALGYLLAFVALDRITFVFETAPSVSPWYPPPGLTVAILLTFGLTYAPVTLIAVLISGLWIWRIAMPFPHLLLLALVIAGGYSGITWILQRVLPRSGRLHRLRDLIRFIVVIIPATGAIAALAIGVFVAAGTIPRSDYVLTVLDFWVGDLIGIFTLTPFMLVYGFPIAELLERRLTGRPTAATGVRMPRLSPERRKIPSVIVAIASLLAVLWLAFGSPAAAQINLFYLCFLPCLWIALQHGFQGAVLGTLFISTGIILSASLFSFEFASSGEEQILLLSIALVSLSFGALTTERNRAERQRESAYRALQASEARYRRMYNATPMMLHSIDREGRLLSVSDYWLETMGYERSEVIGRRSTEFLTAASRRYAEEVTLPRWFENGVAWHVPYQFVKKNGEVIDVRLSAIAERDAAGEIVRSMAVVIDVTEQKQAEEAYRALVDHSLQGLCILQEGRVVFANQALAEMFGYTVDELLAMSPQETQASLTPDGQAFLNRQKQARREGDLGADHYNIQVYTKDGDLRWTEQFVTPITYQGQTALQIAVIDRTERQQAEAQREAALEALRESEERFRLTIELATIGVAIVDHEGNLTECNAALAEMIGYSREALLALNFADFTHPEDLARERELIQELWSEKTTQYRMEKRYIHRDGHTVWVDLTASMFLGETPDASFGFAFVQDITARKEMERQREAALAALRESEARFRKSFDTELIGMAISRRRDGMYLEANPGFLKMTGYTAGEVIGHTSEELSFLYPAQREALVSNITSHDRLHNQELTFPNKRGELRTILFSIGPITVQGEDCLLATMVDITARKRAAERTRALLRAADRLSAALTQEDLLNTVCQEIGRALDISAVSVLRWRPKRKRFTLERAIGLPEAYERTYRSPDQKAYARFAHESMTVVPDVQQVPDRLNHALYVACDVRTLVEVSLVYKDELLGVLNVHTLGANRDFTPGELVLLRGIAGQAAQAIMTARLLDQLRTSQHQLEQLSGRLVEAQEIERRALARELHDELGQILTVIKLNLQALHAMDLGGESQAQEAVNASLRAADGAIEQVRRLSRDLRPSLLDNLGLVPALRSFVDQQAQLADFDAIFSADPFLDRVPDVVENAYFRIAQEAMTNVIRHAEAARVVVTLRREDDALVLIIRDDGAGFDVETALDDVQAGCSLGLVSMRERAHLIGGSFEVISEAGRGTEIRVRTPLTSPQPSTSDALALRDSS